MTRYRRSSQLRSWGLLALNVVSLAANAWPGSDQSALLLASVVLTTGVILNETISEGLDR